MLSGILKARKFDFDFIFGQFIFGLGIFGVFIFSTFRSFPPLEIKSYPHPRANTYTTEDRKQLYWLQNAIVGKLPKREWIKTEKKHLNNPGNKQKGPDKHNYRNISNWGGWQLFSLSVFESSLSYLQLCLCLETYFYAISCKLVLVILPYCKVLYWIITNNNNIISKLKKKDGLFPLKPLCHVYSAPVSTMNELECSLLTITNI